MLAKVTTPRGFVGFLIFFLASAALLYFLFSVKRKQPESEVNEALWQKIFALSNELKLKNERIRLVEQKMLDLRKETIQLKFKNEEVQQRLFEGIQL
jgi:hypothetical protein